MKLHSPTFERALKRGVKRAVKSSRVLKKEYRAAGKYRRHYSSYFLGRFISWFILGALTAAIASFTKNPGAPLGIISLWGFIFIFFHANSIILRLFGSTDLAILTLLPVARDTIFRWELQKFFRLALWSLGDMLVALGTLACLWEFPGWKWWGVIFVSVFTWAVSVALGALCAARVRRDRYLWVIKWFFPALVLSFFASRAIPHNVLADLIDRTAPALNFLLPTGWALSQFQLFRPDSAWPLLMFIFPAAAIIGTLPNSLARLRSFYVFREVERPQAYDLDPVPAAGPPTPSSQTVPPLATYVESPRRRGPTEIIEIIESRHFLAPPRWPDNGDWEALLWRWLSPRERALSEFAFPNGLRIFGKWKRIALMLAIAAALGFSAGASNPNAKNLIVAGGVVMTAMMALASVNESGTAFRLALFSGVRIPTYAYHPIGMPELKGLLLKVTAVQIPLLLAWSAVSGLLISQLGHWPVLPGLTAGLRGGVLIASTRFIFAVFSISAGTNDTQRLGLRNLLLIISIAPFGILFLVLGGIGTFFPGQLIGWGLTALAVLSGWLFFRVYGRFYNRGFFDLMNLPQRRSF